MKFTSYGKHELRLFLTLFLGLSGVSLLLPSPISNILFIVFIGLSVFVVNFFRDPERKIPQEKDLLIAPADGKIVLLKNLTKHPRFSGAVTQISIFLSAIDVHVNRIPFTGKVELVDYHPGEYVLAWNEKASEKNEHSEFLVRNENGVGVYFKQITGYVARRIVYDLNPGQHVEAGTRFGMMKFGSRMDIFVDERIVLDVSMGQRVVAGETILGKVKN